MDFKYVERMNKLYQNKHYLKDRELSILEFQMRLLDLIWIPETPFMERLKFMKIISSNLEEFISVRLPDVDKDKRELIIHTIEAIYSKIGNFLNDINESNGIALDEKASVRIIPDKSFRFIYSGEDIDEISNEMQEVLQIKDSCTSKSVLYADYEPSGTDIICAIKVPRSILLLKEYYAIYESICSGVQENYFHTDLKPSLKYDYYEELQSKDILIRNPYESYDTVLDFIDQMCKNENIKAVFITLYRTANESKIVQSLITARKLNKEVFIYIEPTARDNEALNLKNIQRLQKNHIHVSCNYYNYKVHGKLFCAVDKDNKMFAHIGTGNYNEDTAKCYTDMHLLTANQCITTEAFQILMSLFRMEIYRASSKDKHIYSSPLNFRSKIIELINGEIEKGENGRIFIKCNSVCDCAIIDKLYQASECGVEVKIICRTGCSIRIHHNLEIRSKVGQYLEHDRFYIFGDRIFISSADLLLRNINKRLEILCEILQEDNKNKVFLTFKSLWTDPLIHVLHDDGRWSIIQKDC